MRALYIKSLDRDHYSRKINKTSHTSDPTRPKHQDPTTHELILVRVVGYVMRIVVLLKYYRI